jgi:glycerol uptake facilitator-like aquaporin
MKTGTALSFITAQIVGAILGTVIANILYSKDAFEISQRARDGGNLLLSEVIATAGLVFVIYQFSAIKSGKLVPAGVALWIFSAYFFTSSTSFANPAISIGRIFTNSFAGIAPHSALEFIPFQVIGAVLGYLVFRYFSNSGSKVNKSKRK